MAKHILCADDSVTIRKVIEITFANSDFYVTLANSADEALALAKQNRPDLVLADAVMPGKSGYDLCQEIKSDPGLRDVPVLIMAGGSEPYDETRGRSVGAAGAVTKPWDSQAMLDKVIEIAGGDAGAPAPVAAASRMPLAPPANPSSVAPGQVSKAARARSAPAAPRGLARPPMIKGLSPGKVVRHNTGQPKPSAPPAAPRPPGGGRRGGRAATIMGMPAVVTPPAGGAPTPPRRAVVPGAPLAPPPAVPRSPVPEPASMASAAAAAVAKAAVPRVKQAVAQAGHDPRGVEYEAIAKLSREVIEKIAWEIVPELAEVIIRENLGKPGKG